MSTDFSVEDKLGLLENTIDYFWTQFAGIVVLLMQLGFAFLEGGCVRYKNMQSIMIKVYLNTCIAVICWWLVGYGICMGSGKFAGTDYYAGSNFAGTKNYSHWVLQTSVGAAANSIVSGGAVERMSIIGYCFLSVAFSSFIYPICAHWTWGGGWLQDLGYIDLAGSGTIHFMSALGALVLTVMLGARKNRWNEKYANEFNPSNTTYICLSTLSLYTCWIFFNAGSTTALSGTMAYAAGRATTNTIIAGASGGLTLMVLHYYKNRNEKSKFSLVMICNGNLAGLVAVTGSCDGIELWAAFVIGILGGLTYWGFGILMHKFKVDDPVDAFPIHGGCGLIGAQFPGWFNTEKGIFYGHGAKQWGIQLLGTVVWLGWSVVLHAVVIFVLKILGLLNVTPEVEEKGLDYAQCGGGGFDYQLLPPILSAGGYENVKSAINQKQNNVPQFGQDNDQQQVL
ncbi:unnamed protein product [Paramecium octaurelia]|uniref:Ammonium transporter AmtB-like domain-containing protein n=1 Tax=Paramecium octaurelia TaxID=43137 RepID=A0A8S1V942_PAROT|nr:unnamed protein product [Paramecium octaurelia]